MTRNEKKIVAAIKERDSSAKNFEPSLVLPNFLGGMVYYIEYESKAADEGSDFFYVLIDESGYVHLYDDGVEVIKALQRILDKRRTFLQRLNDFTLVELIGAIIAVLVTLAFLALMIFQKNPSQEFTGIFAIIAGYYFGKNTQGKEYRGG